MGKRDVIDAVLQYKALVLDHFDSATVYLYGSYSKGKARPDSDIDVAVVVPEVKDDFLNFFVLYGSRPADAVQRNATASQIKKNE